jgi:hypothetical protein
VFEFNFSKVWSEMLFNNKKLNIFIELNLHFKKIDCIVLYIIVKIYEEVFIFFINQIINKIQFIIFEVLCNV